MLVGELGGGVITGAISDIIQAFAALVRSEIEDERVDLLRSALTFARIEDPQLGY